MLEQFVNQYAVQKTLRFELIPMGKTLENIERKGILQTDTELAESYKKMKKTIDEFHKWFIDKSLENAVLTGLEDFYTLYTAGAEEKKTDEYKNKYKAIKDSLRKEIVACFKKQDIFNILNKKELVQIELKNWIQKNHPDLYYDESFRTFTTYFTGYNENRMNMYSEEEKATAVSHRLIDENLPKFIDNIRIFGLVKESPVAENFAQILSDMEPWLNVASLEDLFSLGNYNDTLTQKQIEAYNLVIGGRTEENGKIRGLNEYINLYNQRNPNAKLPKFKMLYKQILSERVSISWLPEAFENAEEMLTAVNDFYLDYTENIANALRQIFCDLPERDENRLYINGAAVTDISNRLFGYYGVLRDALGIDPDEKKKADYYSVAQLQTALDDYVATMDEETNPRLFAVYNKSCIVSSFSDEFSREDGGISEKIINAYEVVKDLLNTAHGEDFRLTKEDTEHLKSLLDSLMELLHFIKPLYLKSDVSLPKDDVFYGAFSPVFEQMQLLTKLYDKVRNFVTKKPYSTEKVKLNFDCSTLLDGWDVNKETQNLGVLLLKDGKYYLGIMNKANNKIFSDLKPCEDKDCYQKVMYKLLPGPNKMLPKVFFSKSRIDEFQPSDNILRIRKNETFKKGPLFSLEDCHTLIDFYKASIAKHPDWRQFDFHFSPTEQYADISEFYREISDQGYRLTYMPVSVNYVDKLVEEGKLYLFQIYNKDFSPCAKGKPNLHTLYWKALFDEKNLADVVYKLNGEAEIFYRKASIPEANKTVHKANAPIGKKNPHLEGQTSTFAYDITKDRRYTVDKFQFHVPITMNFKADGTPRINGSVCEYLKNNPDVNVIGIDRGERHLLYLSMIDRSGRVVKDKNGKFIQYSLNTVSGEYKNSEGKSVLFETPYHELLDKREKEREEAREAWDTVENIKELKTGYLSQVVHHIAKLMVDYNAIVVLEDLNGGFKNGRKKVEKQVYQNFEKALIEKLNYLVFKDAKDDEPGGLYRALQLTEKFKSFKELNKQSGFLFYIPAWNTSKIDPVTGFVDLLKPKTDMNMKEAAAFFSKFDGIRYNAEKDYFEFAFDYANFTDKANGSRTNWTVCTFGDTRYVFDRYKNNGKGGYENWNVTERLKALFDKNGIDYRSGDLRSAITSQRSSPFFASLIKLLKVTLAMRYSSAEDQKDFILSPVADENGEFYCSEGRNDGLPQDADANGAFNIARKGLWVLKQIDQAEKYTDWTTKITNSQWLHFAQTDL